MQIKAAKLIGCLSLLTLAISAFAHADVLERGIKIETDDTSNGTEPTYINVTRAADGSLTSLIYETNPPVKPFTFDQLRAGTVVLKYNKKTPVVLLQLETPFDQAKGGFVDVQFLYNGATKNYKDFRIGIDVQQTVVYRSDPDSADSLSDKNPFTSVFNYLFFYKKTLLGREVGIERVQPNLVSSIAD